MISRSAISALDSPRGDEREHLALAHGQLFRAPARRAASGRAARAKSLDQPAGDRWARAAPHRAATTRMAASSSSGGASLSMNPLAPTRSAPKTYSSRSNVVRISTRGSGPGGGDPPGRLDARRAPACGCPSGPRRAAAGGPAATASAPSAASPTHVQVGLGVDQHRGTRPRTSAWSSATTTPMVMRPARRAPGLPDRPRPGRGAAGRPSPGIRRPRTGPASRLPPNAAARSCMPTRPCRGAARRGPPGRRCPRSLSTVISTPSRPACTRTVARAPGACLTTLVSASWTMRYAVRRGGGRQRRHLAGRRPATPVSRRPARCRPGPRGRRRRGREPGCGASPSSSRSRPRMRRSSSSALRPVTSTACRASSASAGRVAPILRPTPAWKVTTLSVWATTSCSSRAILTRSSRTASPAVIRLTLGFLLPAGGQVPPALPHAVADEPQRPRGQQAVYRVHRAVRPGRRGDEPAGEHGLGADQRGHRDRAAAGHRHRVDRHAERDVHVELGAAERG